MSAADDSGLSVKQATCDWLTAPGSGCFFGCGGGCHAAGGVVRERSNETSAPLSLQPMKRGPTSNSGCWTSRSVYKSASSTC
jgi:hypothetical protein